MSAMAGTGISHSYSSAPYAISQAQEAESSRAGSSNSNGASSPGVIHNSSSHYSPRRSHGSSNSPQASPSKSQGISKGKGRAPASQDGMSPPPTVVVSHETGEAQEEPAYEAEYPPIADAEKETRTVEQYLANMSKQEKTRQASIRRAASQKKSPSSPSSSSASGGFLSRVSSVRSRSTSGSSFKQQQQQQQQQNRQSRVGMVKMSDEDEDEDDDYDRQHGLTIDTKNVHGYQTTHEESPASDTTIQGREPASALARSGSRFSEDLQYQHDRPFSPPTADSFSSSNINKRHSVASTQPASDGGSGSSKRNPQKRFSLTDAGSSGISPFSDIFRPYSRSESRSSIHVMGPVPESDLGAIGPAPLGTPDDIAETESRKSYFGGSSHGHHDSPRKGRFSRYDEVNSPTESSPPAGEGSLEQHAMRQGQSVDEARALMKYRQSMTQHRRRGSSGMQHQRQQEDGQGQPSPEDKRKNMGWLEYFCCMGCFEEAGDDDEQAGRTGPDLLS